MKQLVIYIAGPYRAPSAKEISENVRRAEAVGQEILRRGHVALCPHSMTHDWDIGTGIADEVFLQTDLVLLSRCDAICMVEGWWRSIGAKAELERARELGLQVFMDVYHVPEVTRP
ncbi:MAG TPA: DUF1937 family protein [Planctomycetota bacterium]|nr:DUF1937 family protein [Planctomycetota bacterium]